MTPWWAAHARTRWTLLNRPWWLRAGAATFFFAAINWMIFTPSSSFDEVHLFLAYQDKLAHGAIFLTQTLLVRWALPAGAGRDSLDRWLSAGAPAVLALYACSTEVLQPLVGGAGRRFEWLDVASNIAGICSGWLLFGLVIAVPKSNENLHGGILT